MSHLHERVNKSLDIEQQFNFQSFLDVVDEKPNVILQMNVADESSPSFICISK